MRYLIVSDTHGNDRNLERAIMRSYPMDGVFHLGDLEGSESYIEDICPCPVYMVSGNNDFFSPAPSQQIVEIDELRIFMTHGHRYGVAYDMEDLKKAAKANQCRMAFFGHTHRPEIIEEDDMVLVNPGSLTYPRQAGRRPSYAILEVDEKGSLDYVIHYLD